MNKKHLYIIIFILAVGGLLYIQNQYLKIGLTLAREQFNQKAEELIPDLQEEFKYKNELTFLLLNAMDDQNYFGISKDSITKVSNSFLQDFLKYKLSENGIKADFSYRIYTRNNLNLLQSSQPLDTQNILLQSIPLDGYLSDELERPIILELQFGDLNRYFLSQVNGLFYPSLILMGIIILTVVWVLYSIYWHSNIIHSKNEFLNNLTHELKTPIFSINLATKILEESSSGQYKDLIEVIRKQTNRIKDQTNQVLELASIESKRTLDLTPTDVRPIIKDICTDFKNLSKMEGFEFECQIEEGDIIIKNDRLHFENAIYQILDNAKKSSSTPVIRLKAYTENDSLKIVIKDNGEGIPQEEQKKIFQKFYKVHARDKSKGHGIGLSYVKQIMKKHKGQIILKSEQSKGTTVTLKFPLRTC